MNNTTSSAPLLVFRVLSNAAGLPAGLLVDAGPGSEAAWPDLFEDQYFGDLSAAIPCFYREAASSVVAAALAGAGWSALASGALQREDERLVKEQLPPGARLIEGDWYMAAPSKATGAQAASRALALQLAALVAADAHTHDIEALLRKDPTLSYHLLRLVNSLGMGVGRRISSFSQAILILGRQQLRRWVNLMLFSARQGDPRSGMLLARVAVRGRVLELLAKVRGADKQMQDQAFIAGMFSLLGVLFGMPLPEVLVPLSMSEAVQQALLGYEGDLGRMLRVCEAMERGDFGAIATHLEALQVSGADYNAALVEANYWMLGAIRGDQGGEHA